MSAIATVPFREQFFRKMSTICQRLSRQRLSVNQIVMLSIQEFDLNVIFSPLYMGYSLPSSLFAYLCW